LRLSGVVLALVLVASRAEVSMSKITFDDCTTTGNSNWTRSFTDPAPGSASIIAGKVRFGGSGSPRPQSCRYNVQLSSWALGQQISFRVIQLTLPGSSPQAAGTPSAWSFNVVPASSPGDVWSPNTNMPWAPSNLLVNSGGTPPLRWKPGQFDTYTSTNTLTPATNSFKGFTITLDYLPASGILTDPIPVTELNPPSEASFALEWQLSEDLCPGSNLWLPLSLPPYPALATCQEFVNSSCCQKSNEVGGLDNGDMNQQFNRPQPLFFSSSFTVPRDSACYEHYGIVQCGANCHPMSRKFYTLNYNTSVWTNEFNLCIPYCKQVYDSCAPLPLIATSGGASGAYSNMRVLDLYGSDSESFCLAFFQPIATLLPSNPRVKVGAVGNCFDAATASFGVASASASPLFIAFAVLATLWSQIVFI